jgi:hypothetical protein
MSDSKQYGRELSPSEIVMLEIEIRELRDKVIKLQQENFLLQEKNKQMVWASQVQD